MSPIYSYPSVWPPPDIEDVFPSRNVAAICSFIHKLKKRFIFDLGGYMKLTFWSNGVSLASLRGGSLELSGIIGSRDPCGRFMKSVMNR